MASDTQTNFHSAAEIFPLMEGEALNELASDIKANGLREPIWRHEGQVIDGRNRCRACAMAGVQPQFREWDGKGSLVDFIMSLNLHRRHLTPSQRAMVAARAREFYDQQAKERQRLSEGRGQKGPVKIPDVKRGDSRDLAGKAAGVSGTYVDRATKVIQQGTPELVKAVDEGRMSVTTAAVLSSEAPEAQRAECAKPGRSRTYRSVSAPTPAPDGPEPEEEEKTGPAPKVLGIGIVRANEAINCLTRIPKNDALRSRGFQLVTDWIRRNK